jgi:hypothetical protein
MAPDKSCICEILVVTDRRYSAIAVCQLFLAGIVSWIDVVNDKWSHAMNLER